MAESLRNVYKRSEISRDIRDRVKELNIEQINVALKKNNLSTRGTTADLAERLIRFEIREQDPNLTVRWDDAVDYANFIPIKPNTENALSSDEVNATIRAKDMEGATGITETSVEIHPPPRLRCNSGINRQLDNASEFRRVVNSPIFKTPRQREYIRNEETNSGVSPNAHLIMSEIHTLHRQGTEITREEPVTSLI